MSFVCVDLGASSTRYVSNSGAINVIPNNMQFLPDMIPSRIIPDTPDLESCLEVQITKEEPDAMGNFPANVLIGIMATKYNGIDETPDVNTHKHIQRINYISAIVSCAVSKLKYDLTDTINLYLAVPPNSLKDAEAAFKANIVGTYTVRFPKYNGGATVTFKVENVNVHAESYMAVTSFFFNMSGVVRDKAKQFLSGTVLSLDIGASTTDLAIIENGRYLDKSGQTYRIGGNVARDTLIDEVCSKYAMDMPMDMAEVTMAEGRLQQGNSHDDVSDLVTIAKENLAKQLVQYMQTYFKRIQKPIQAINAVVVSGGGSMQSQYANDEGEIVITTKPMSYFVTKELTQWSKNTEVIEYGEDARFANVKGLFIRAKVDEVKMEQAKAAGMASPMATQPQGQSVQPQVQPVQQVAQAPAQAAQTQAQPVQQTPVQAAQPQVAQATATTSQAAPVQAAENTIG